jgi:hypothetical protein
MSELDELLARVRSGEGPAGPGRTGNQDYNALLQQVREPGKAIAQSSLNASAFNNGDIEGEKIRLSRDMKAYFNEDWSPAAIDTSEAKRRLAIAKGVSVMDTSPKLTQNMVNQNFANIAHDDTQNLGDTERTFNTYEPTDGPITRGVKAMISGLSTASAGVVGAVRAPVDVAAAFAQPLAGTILPENPFARVSEGLRKYQETISGQAKAMMPKGEGIIESGIYSGLASLSSNLATLPLALMPGGQAAALTAMTLPVGGGAYGEAKDKGLTTAQSLIYGTSQAAIEYATEKLPMNKLIGDLKVGTPFYKTLATQVALEIPGEQLATVLQDMNEWAALNPEKPFSSYIEERPNAAAQTLVATIVGAGGQVTVAKGVQTAADYYDQRIQDATRAQQGTAIIEKMNALATASKVRERDAETFRDWINQVSEDSPIENVYIEADVLRQSGIADQLAAISPSVRDQLLNAEIGGEITIPVSEYMTNIAPTEFSKQIIDDLRIEGEDMTRREAQATIEQITGELKKATSDAIAKQDNQEAFITSAREVETTMFEQLKATKAMPDSVARVNAQMVRDMYVVKAAEMGMTPTELYAAMPYRVVSERDLNVAPAELFDQSGQVRTETPAFQAFYGNSVFKDEAGKPVVLYHGTADDVSSFDPDHPNRKDSGWLGTGVYLTDSTDMAEGYADQKARALGPKGQNVMPLYARLENPYYATPEDKARVKAGGREAADAFTAELQAKGHDGVIYQAAPDAKEIVVFDNKAVKSQFNSGTWSLETTDLLNQGEQVKPAIDAEEDAQADDVAEITQGEIPEGVDQGAVLENALKIATGQVWNKGRELKVALQEGLQKLASSAGVDVSAPSEQTSEYLVRVGVKDALFALQQNVNAIGWYDEKTRQALAVMALIHPEIATNENVKFAFVWALATTSNGMKVDKNFELAEAAYSYYKTNKQMPTDLKAGQAQGAINDSLGLFNELVKEWGIDNLRKFMLTDYTVGEISSIAKDLKPGGEHADTKVKGASIIGPKIGNGFFSNLYGNFDSLTMDRWLVRTWGRWTGTLIKTMPEQEAKATDRLNAAVKAATGDEKARLNDIVGVDIASTEIDALAVAIQEASMDPGKRNQLNESAQGVELRKAGNSLAKYLDGQKEAPAGPHERTYIRSVFSSILEEVKTNPAYADLTMADLQAVLWYAEKRLYETAKDDIAVDEESTEGYSDEDAPDYANAAAAVAREKGVSERKITNALKKESKDERSRRARLQDETAPVTEGQPVEAGGFTQAAKRFFAGAVATRTARANRVGNEKQSWSYTGRGRTDGGKPRVLKSLGITYVEQWKAGANLGRVYRGNGIATPAFYEMAPGEVNAAKFAQAITDSKANSGKVGAAVYVYPTEDYAGMRLFVSEDGKSGVAVKKDGDIVSVFSSGGAGRSVMELAVAAGGTKLDAFETILPDFYAAHGFVATSRLTWSDDQAPQDWDKAAFAKFNDGKPDVVFMALDDNYTGWHKKTDGKRFSDYDDAVAEQSRAVKRNEKQRKQAGQPDLLKQQSKVEAKQIAGQYAQPARGGFDPKRMTTILNEKADFSTFAHETSHFYVEMLFRMATMSQATTQIKADADTLLEFFGVPDIDTWNNLSVDEKRKAHESFAYNYEIYLFEGKSPSIKQQSMFDKFSSWLRRVYKSIRDDLNATYKAENGVDLPLLTGEVRQVMDRMLASDEQIKQAEQVRNMMPLYQSQQESGMSDGEWAAYQEMIKEAHDASVTDLTKATMRQMKWLSNARSRILKDIQKTADVIRKQVSAEVAEEIKNQPVYRAMEFLKRGTLDGTPVDNPTKLSIPEIEAMYGDSPIVGAIKKALGFGKYGMLGTDSAIHPDQAAEIFGFTSGDAMVRALMEAKPMKDAINERTDQRMLEEYGDMNDARSVELAVEEALHNEARARFVAVELRHLAKATQPVRLMLQAAKQVAKGIINGKAIKEIKPREYSLAEARAARQATELMKKGQSQDAAKAKQNQLVQNQLAAEAVAARQEVDKAVEGFRKFFRADDRLSKTRNMDLVDASRSILAYYGLGQKGKNPVEYIEKLRAYNPELFAEVEPLIIQAASGSKMYTDLTMDEFRILRDTVEALWFQSKRENEVMIEGKAMAIDDIVTELNARLEAIGIPAEVPGERSAPTNKDRAVRQFYAGKAITRRVEHWADATDGAAGPGAFTKYIWRPVRAALDAYRIDRNNYVKRYVELIQKLDLPVGKIDAPELNYTFGDGNGGIGKAELLGALVHTGNESNMKKLLLGRGWATQREDGSIDTANWKAFEQRMITEGKLTKADYDFAQAVWDLNEELKPMAQEAHKDIFGYYFKEVSATPVVTPFGTYRGGYVPAKTDPFIVRDAQRQAKMEELESDFRQSMPSTGMGFTKGRVEYNKPLSLDVRLGAKHIDDVIRFAYVQPAIKDALKILRKRDFADNLTRVDPNALEDMLIPWLNRSARQITSEPGKFKAMDAFWSGVRSRTGISIMFANITNALQQVTGYFPAMLKVKPTYLKSSLFEYMGSSQKVTEEVAELSQFMADRLHNQVFDMQDAMNQLLLNPSKFDKVQSWAQHHGYFLQSAFQNQVDVVTWTATFNQTMAESGKDTSDKQAMSEAVHRADAAVRLTQSSLTPEDVAAFEVGTPFYKTLIQFSGYFNMLANLNSNEFIKVFRDMGWRGNKGKLGMIYMMGFAMPMIVADAIVRSLGGGWDDEDDDGYLDEFAEWFFGSQIKGATALLPFGTAAYTALTTAFNDKPYDDRMTTSPSVSTLESATIGVGKTVINVVSEDKEITGRNVRDVLTLLSLVTGIPVTVLGRPVGYAIDVERGNIEPTSKADYVRGLVTGKASELSKQ